jgi:uncharacterized hydrophobic protein (TIGR00271 family)
VSGAAHHPHLHPEPAEQAEELDDTPFAGRGRHWRPRVEPHERRQVIELLFGNGGGRAHWSRYFALLTLSAVIATAGLTANSGAVVIGAMLVAPLMTPIVGFVAAISLNMPRRALVAAMVVISSTILTIAVAAGLTAVLPSNPLGPEVLSRTAPDVRDLLVALAAGVAGTWATARTNVSAALPGVAVAVALVPPLAAVGVAIEAGEFQYAEGALLLYVTNLVAMVGIGMITMVAVGFVPTSLLARTWRTLGTTTVISLVAIGTVSWPLWQRADRVANEARTTTLIEETVSDWLTAAPALEIDSIDRRGRSITVDVVGPVEPPPADELSQTLIARLEDRYDVRVRWSQRLDGPVAPPSESEDERLIDTVGEVADAWLVEVDRPDLTIEAITVSGTDVVVRVVGPQRPPSGIILQRRLDERLPDDGYRVGVVWSEITVVDDQAATLDDMRSRIVAAARAWGEEVGVEVVAVDATFDAVLIRTAGVEAPSESGPLHDLVAEIGAEYGVQPTVEVTFEERRLVPPVATTTTTTTTSTTSTTTTTTTTTTVPPETTVVESADG